VGNFILTIAFTEDGKFLNKRLSAKFSLNRKNILLIGYKTSIKSYKHNFSVCACSFSEKYSTRRLTSLFVFQSLLLFPSNNHQNNSNSKFPFFLCKMFFVAKLSDCLSNVFIFILCKFWEGGGGRYGLDSHSRKPGKTF
jgi:hypothetical protein